MQFADLAAWRGAKECPTRPTYIAPWRGAFPRYTGTQLARATLMLAWHTARSDRHLTFLLGLTPEVAAIIADLSLSEIFQISDARFKHARPRWEDRPAVWRRLFMVAHS